MLYFAPIVEGHGEVEAVPALFHRIAAAAGFPGQILVNPPIRVKAGSFLNNHDVFRRHIELAAAKAKNRNGVVIILLDSDDDSNCPKEIGPRLLGRARAIRDDVPYLVSLAWREYESWFLTAAQSLRGHHGLPTDLAPPSVPEAIRGAKEWLSGQMPRPYDPIEHQIAFTKIFDLNEARANRSFNRLFTRIEYLLGQAADRGMTL